VRELQHAVERAVILSREPVLQPHHFEGQRLGLTHPLARQAALRSMTPPAAGGAIDGPATPAALPPNAVVLTSLNIDEAEKVLIERALKTSGGNRTKTAELLGISVRTLRNKLNGPGRVIEPA
jgi:DNA-binding NtrC family response regulator